MPANGKITANDVIDSGAIERVQKLDSELRKILASYNDIAKAAQNSSSIKGLNEIIKQRVDLDNESLKSAKLLAQARKEEANAEAAKQRALKAGIQTQKSQLQLEKTQTGARSTNLAAFQKLNSAYLQQSRLLTSLRQRQKDLNIQKQQGIALTRAEQKELASLSARVKQLDRDLKAVDAAAGQFQRNVGNYPRVVGAAVRSLRSFAGAFGFTSGIFLAVSALKETFDIFKQFDQSQADLAAILGKSRNEITKLTRQAKILGSTTAFTASQVALLQLELSKLGFNEEQILDSTRAVEDLAIATGVEAARAAQLAGSAIRGFALEASEADRVASVLAVSTAKSANSFESLEIALPKVSAIANAFGFTIEDTTALLGGLRNAGFEASIAGTSLRQIFLQLADSNGALAKRLGGNVTNFDELVEALKRVEAEGIDLAEAFELTNARSVAAFKVFLQGADDLKVLRDSITGVNDELADLAETKLDSLTGDITLLKSAFEGFVLSVEDGTGKIATFFRTAVQGVTNFLEGLREINTTARQSGVDAARNIIDDFKNTTEASQTEVKDFIVKTIQDAETNIDSLRAKVEELSTTQSKLFNPFNEDKLAQARKDLEKEIAIRDELTNQLNVEQDRRESLIQTVLKLSIEYNEQIGREINVENQLKAFRGQSTLAIERLIKSYQDLIQKKESNNEESSKEQKFARNTIAFYEDFIKKQVELQKNTAQTSEEFQKFQLEIDKARIKILQLQGEFAKIGEGVDLPDLDLTFAEPDTDLESYVEESIRLAKKRADAIQGFEQDIRDAVQNTFSSFSEYYGIDLNAFNSLFDGKKNTVSDYQQIAIESANFILSNQIEKYNLELEANRMKLDEILNSEDSSEEQKRIAKLKSAEEEKRILRERYKAEQDALVAKVAIDTAASVAKILLTASILASNPVTAALAPEAYAQAALAGALGAAQIAFIKSRQIPAFFKGKGLENNYEGAALLNDGGRDEFRVTKEGNVERIKGRNVIGYVKKDDIIVPSFSDYKKQLKDPSSDISQRVFNRVENETQERLKIVHVNTDNKELTKKMDYNNRLLKKIANKRFGTTVNIVENSRKRYKPA